MFYKEKIFFMIATVLHFLYISPIFSMKRPAICDPHVKIYEPKKQVLLKRLYESIKDKKKLSDDDLATQPPKKITRMK